MTAEPYVFAERYVVGALLLDVRVLRAVQEECTPRDFHDGRLAAVYAGVIGMVRDGLPVDVVTVGDRLRSWGVQGVDMAALGAWAADVPTASNAGYYAHMVREAAVRRGVVAVGESLTRAGDDDVAVVLARGIQALTELRDRDATGAAGVRWLRDVLDVPETEDEYDWTVPGLLERGDRFVLTGSEGGGKSTLLRQIAVLSAAGVHPFTSAAIRPLRVLVVDAENSERQWRRSVRRMVGLAAHVGGRDPREGLALECVTRLDLTSATDLGRVHRFVDDARPDMVLIGPLYRLTRGAVNSDDDAAPLLAALDSVRDRHVTLLLEAHAGHAQSSTGDRDLRPRGSSALLGWPEFGMGLRRSREPRTGERSTYELVRWRGDRDARDWPRRLSRGVGQTWPFELTLGG